MSTTLPNMGLVIPDVNMTFGPEWATLLNAALALIDSHDHSLGKGIRVTPSGLNISNDLSFEDVNNAIDLRSIRFFNNSSFSTGVNDRTCFYVLNGELHYIDADANDIQITLNGFLNFSSAITSLTLVDTGFILQSFSDSTKKMRFDASAISPSTTRVYTMPDVTDSIIARSSTDIMTNKSFGDFVTIRSGSQLRFNNAADSQYTSIQSGATTTNLSFTLPITDGTPDQVMKTDGGGQLGWATVATYSSGDVPTAANIAALNSGDSLIRLTGGTNTLIQGIVAGSPGQTLTIYNASTADLQIAHENGAAAAANRIKNPYGLAFIIKPGNAFNFQYDGVQSRWVPTSMVDATNLIGNLTGAAPRAGFIGEKIGNISGTIPISTANTFINVASISLTGGVWDVSFSAAVQYLTTNLPTEFIYPVSFKLTGSAFPDTIGITSVKSNVISMLIPPGIVERDLICTGVIPPIRVFVTSPPLTVTCQVSAVFFAPNPTVLANAVISAIRVA